MTKGTLLACLTAAVAEFVYAVRRPGPNSDSNVNLDPAD